MVTEKKLALSVVCPTPPGNSRQQNPEGPPYKKNCASIPCWRINCEVIPLTVPKHSQLFKKTCVTELQ